MVGARLANLKRGDNQYTEDAQICATSQSDAAQQMQVSTRSVENAAAVQRTGARLANLKRGDNQHTEDALIQASGKFAACYPEPEAAAPDAQRQGGCGQQGSAALHK